MHFNSYNVHFQRMQRYTVVAGHVADLLVDLLVELGSSLSVLQ